MEKLEGEKEINRWDIKRHQEGKNGEVWKIIKENQEGKNQGNCD